MKKIKDYNSSDNMQYGGAYLGVNSMADWTEEEYNKLLGFGNGPKPKKDHMHPPRHPHYEQKERKLEAANDTSLNWVEKGAVTPVKNQGSCGSCWSFSATGSMEGRNFLKNGKLVSLSEQQLVDCSTKQGNEGCNGGLMDYAFKYAEATQMETEAQYPYTGRDGTCHAKGGALLVKDFKDVTPKSPKALMAALEEGPVSVAIDASSILFQLYFGGIMHLFCGDSLDHGVLLVGYGTENGMDYWMLKNSWGAGWGEKGYFRMKRDAVEGKPGFCGLQLQPSYPIF